MPAASSGRERAYAHLRGALLSDPGLAGTFISEQQVAEEVGVSRTPVREALLLLAAEDLVQLVPHRGALVPPVTPEQIRHILDARTVIETWAIREALTSGRAPITEMSRCLERQAKFARRGRSVDFIAADQQFHTHLVDAAGNPVMSRMYETLRARHVPIGVTAVDRSSDRREQVLAEHQAIVDALTAGDEQQAVEAMLAHLLATRRMLVRG